MYPSIYTTYTDPQATDRLNSPSHSSIETAQNTGLEQMERVVGNTSSALGTLWYDVRSADSNGGGHIQTANKGGTGQTSFTKGDLLVATSSSVVTKLAVGVSGSKLVADSNQPTGMIWAGSSPAARVYTTPSTLTWTKPSALSYVVVEVLGGGGGGGGTSTDNEAAAGGGGGGYARKIILASTLGATETVVVGIAGTAGPGSGGTGGTGGTSRFGTVSILSGGGGVGGDSTGADGGDGGAGGGGDINITGSEGGQSFDGADPRISGMGGSSPYGTGGRVVYTIAAGGAVPGVNGSGYGSGGSGGASGDGNDSAGGTGGTGLVIITEYIG